MSTSPIKSPPGECLGSSSIPNIRECDSTPYVGFVGGLLTLTWGFRTDPEPTKPSKVTENLAKVSNQRSVKHEKFWILDLYLESTQRLRGSSYKPSSSAKQPHVVRKLCFCSERGDGKHNLNISASMQYSLAVHRHLISQDDVTCTSK